MSDNNESGGRTLGGGASEPLPSNWARPAQPRVGRVGAWSDTPSSSSRTASGARLTSLADINAAAAPPAPAGGHAGHGHDSDDDDDDSDAGEPQNYFAGGERSGVSIQGPPGPNARPNVPGGHMVRDLLRRAAEAGPPPGQAPSSAHASAFSGGGHVLGGEDRESSFIPDPTAPPPELDQEASAIRHLTFWQDGFSVEDGELMRYADPENEQILAQINTGQAPPHILGVQPGQPVELRVAKRLSEKYTPPPKKPMSAFSGSGNRLGAPVPTVISSESAMPGSFPAAASTSAEATHDRPSMNTMFEVDQAQPTTSIQVRLADGTRIVCRMNLTHKVQDIRNFINASRPENLTRSYTIGTAFPNRKLEDDSQTIEAAGLQNSVVMQRWV